MTDQTGDITIRLSAESHQALLVHCGLTGRNADEVVGALVHGYLQGPGARASFEAALERVRTEYREALDELAK